MALAVTTAAVNKTQRTFDNGAQASTTVDNTSSTAMGAYRPAGYAPSVTPNTAANSKATPLYKSTTRTTISAYFLRPPEGIGSVVKQHHHQAHPFPHC